MTGRGSLNVEEDILYQWRLRRRLEEARREAKSEGTRTTHVQQTTLDTGMETGIPDLGTGQGTSSIRTGRIGRPMEPVLSPLAGAAVTKCAEREEVIGTLTGLGVVGSSSEEHGRVESPTPSSTTTTSSSSAGVNKKDEVVEIDRSSSHTCTAEEEQHTQMDKQQTSTNTGTENLTPDPLGEGEEEGLGASQNQNTIPPSSRGPEDRSSSSDVEGEPKTAPVNQSVISESTLTSETQLNQPTTVVLQAHTPSLHGDGYHGNDGLDLEGGAGVEESSYWTISPCGSPDSGQTPPSLGPLINEV